MRKTKHYKLFRKGFKNKRFNVCRSGHALKHVIAPVIIFLVLGASVSLFFACGFTYSDMEVYFIDVGQADSVLIKHDGHNMLIDGGNAADSGLVYSFLKEKNVKRLDYVICTHPHEDHSGGLSGALSYADADYAFSPVKEADIDVFNKFKKVLLSKKTELSVPGLGSSYKLGSSYFTILGPVFITHENYNNDSLMIKLVHGNNSFLFTGDAEIEEEYDVLEACFDVSCDVLKVGHHGSRSSTSEAFLHETSPKYAVISVGKDNSYGHPSDIIIKRLEDSGAKIFRTDKQGTVLARSDGKKLKFRTDTPITPGNMIAGDSKKPDDEITDYVINKSTKKFHLPECSRVKEIKKENIIYFSGTKKELTDMGYEPCVRCGP